jgi:hypothetical protein
MGAQKGPSLEAKGIDMVWDEVKVILGITEKTGETHG